MRVALYLAIAGELALAAGSQLAATPRVDLALAALGIAVAALGLAGSLIRRRGWIAAVGFAAQAVWAVLPLELAGTLAATLISVGGLALGSPRPIPPVDTHRALAALARTLWLRCGAGIAFGVLFYTLVWSRIPQDTVLPAAVVAMYAASAFAVGAFAVRALRLGAVARRFVVAGGLAAWSAAVIAIHAVRAYRDFYDHVRGWDLEILFLPPQLATALATALAMSAAARLTSARDDLDALTTMRVRGMVVAVTLLSLLAIGIEFVALAAPEAGYAIGFVLLVGGSLHLLASGLAADTFALAARALPAVDLPAARLRSRQR